MTLIRDLDTYRSLMALDLRPDQREALRAILRDQVADLETVEHMKAQSAADAPAALDALRAAVPANQGVSEEVKKAVFRVEAPSKPDLATERHIARTLLCRTTLKALDPGASVPAQATEVDANLEATLADIRVLNLVNSLYLTTEQMRSLSALSARATREYADLDARRTDLAKESLPVLSQARDAYVGGERPEAWLAAQLAQAGRGVKALRDEEEALMSSYLAPVRAILTTNQIDMVANFIPCTVPVQSLTNPERVGQADGGDRLEMALGRLRGLPEQRLPRRRRGSRPASARSSSARNSGTRRSHRCWRGCPRSLPKRGPWTTPTSPSRSTRWRSGSLPRRRRGPRERCSTGAWWTTC